MNNWKPIKQLAGGTWAILWDSKPFGGDIVIGCYMVGIDEWWVGKGKKDIKPTHFIPLPKPPEDVKCPFCNKPHKHTDEQS